MFVVEILNQKTEMQANVIFTDASSPLQYVQWGEVKKTQGWDSINYEIYDESGVIGTALVLLKCIPKTRFKFAFMPFGPVIVTEYRGRIEEVVCLIVEKLKLQKVLLLKIHPYIEYCGFKFHTWHSAKKMLYSETFIVDLTLDEEQLLANLHKKLRNEVRKAKKMGTSITTNNTLEGLKAFYAMHLETFERTNYPVQPFAMFEQIFQTYVVPGKATIKFAQAGGKKISSAIFLKSSSTYLYMWGASVTDNMYNKYEGQKYLLWETLLEAKNEGAQFFDLGGVTVGAEKGSKREGIYTFKSRFGGDLKILPGTFDIYVGNKFIGALVAKLLNLYLGLKER